MRTRRHALTVGAAAVSLALLAAACGGDSGGGGDGGTTGLTGTVKVSGSSTVQPISSLVAELFNEDNPDVTISVDGPGTGDGFALFCKGETDISDASRPIKDEEIAACQAKGIDYVELEDRPRRHHGDDEPGQRRRHLPATGGHLRPDRAGVRGLRELVGRQRARGKEVGAGHAPYPDVPLDIIGPGEESGTYDAFIELTRDDGSADPARSPGGPGRGHAAGLPVLAERQRDHPGDRGLRQLARLGGVRLRRGERPTGVKEAGGRRRQAAAWPPTADTIADGSYPLSRALYIYVNTAKADVEHGAEGVRGLLPADLEPDDSVTQAGYVALPEDQIAATQAAVEPAGGSSS